MRSRSSLDCARLVGNMALRPAGLQRAMSIREPAATAQACGKAHRWRGSMEMKRSRLEVAARDETVAPMG